MGSGIAHPPAQARRQGLGAISWPTELGGQGGSRIDQYIVEEELARADLPVSRGGGGVPAITQHGTPEQKQEFVRPAVTDDVYFALGFTEPHAGADLASLQCRAVRDGDEYVINGQKMYTSAAHVCTHIYLMARTDPMLPKHSRASRSSCFRSTRRASRCGPCGPFRTTRRRRRHDLRHQRTNEIFFEDVRIPVEPAGQGERRLARRRHGPQPRSRRRLALSDLGAARRGHRELSQDDRLDGYAPAKSPRSATRSRELWIEAQVCRLMTMRSMSIVEHGGNFTYEGSAEKVWAPEHGVRTTEAIAQMLGPYGQLLNGSPHASRERHLRAQPAWAHSSPASTTAARRSCATRSPGAAWACAAR